MENADNAERKRLQRAASRARKKLTAGIKLTAEETAQLEAWEQLKRPRGRPRKGEELERETEREVEPEPIRPEPITVEPPIKVLGSHGKPSGDWRDRYWQHSGREATCVQIASIICGALEGMRKYAEDNGVRCLISREQIVGDGQTQYGLVMNAWIATVDSVLPQNFEARPEPTAAITSAYIVGSAAYAARKKKAAGSAPPQTVIESSGAGTVRADNADPDIAPAPAKAPAPVSVSPVSAGDFK